MVSVIYRFNFYLQSFFLSIFILIFITFSLLIEVFFLFQGLGKLREVAEMKYMQCAWERWTPGAGAGHDRYPYELFSRPGVSWDPAGWWDDSSFPQHFLTNYRGPMGSLPFRPCCKRVYGAPLLLLLKH